MRDCHIERLLNNVLLSPARRWNRRGRQQAKLQISVVTTLVQPFDRIYRIHRIHRMRANSASSRRPIKGLATVRHGSYTHDGPYESAW